MSSQYLDRPPRVQPELPIAEVEIPSPPEQDQSASQGIIGDLVPLITMMAFLLASGAGNIMLMIIMGLAFSVSVGFSAYNRRRERQKLAAKRKAYQEQLAELRRQMVHAHNNQRLHYQYNYPDISTVLEIAASKEHSRFGSRLWERRSGDGDFGLIRLGTGSRPSTVVYKLNESASSGNDDPLQRDARKLSDDSRLLSDAPITIPLRPVPKKNDLETTANARHSIGIFGKNPANTVLPFTRAILMHFTAFHSPQDARVFVVGQAQARSNWQWTEWLPHCTPGGVSRDDTPDTGRPPQLDQICFSADKDKVAAFWRRIQIELDQRRLRLSEQKDQEDSQPGHNVTLPFLLVVVDVSGDRPNDSSLNDIATQETVITINQDGAQLGAAILCLADSPARIPGDCLAVIEVASVRERLEFRYSEVGLNTLRYVGNADSVTAKNEHQKFAADIRRIDLKRPAGADLPRSIDLLQMQSMIKTQRVDTVEKLTIKENWERSIQPKNSEWLGTPIGLSSSTEVRRLIFSAREGGDGVHGIIAGTTGSGKSELLLTLVAGLAIDYDPRIVNFVLVDFKGGSAFAPFRRLPHVVDILTNLEANAVERMFVAIQAVMGQRSDWLARGNAKDLVEYRQKVAPKLSPDSSLPHFFPHLFIIVDEFAEMIASNPDYRSRFESITRLGRAVGVSLILATQRPAGVVTDQMRANMKFRICLRVETPEDSRELLGRADAAFLPNLGGRGYIQVGNDVIRAAQIARAGGDYSDDRIEVWPDVIWLDETSMPSGETRADQPMYSRLEIAEALGLKPDETPATLVDWIVAITALRARQDHVPLQTKPWPDPLPRRLSLTAPIDARYLNTERIIDAHHQIVIDEAVATWLNNADEQWPQSAPQPLCVDIGLIDNPHDAEQRLLTIDLSSGPVVLFGSSGRGRTTFLKTLLLAFAARRSPLQLHIYALDFGRGGLKAITAMPHFGASLDASDVWRVEQLMRMLRNIIVERQEKLAQYAGVAEYNAKNPNDALPDIVVAIDNFAEFKESYEYLIPELMALIRDGRAFGVHFVITANTPNDLGGKLYNLLTQRLTFTLTDRSMYSDIVGAHAPNFDNVPGRGLVGIAIQDVLVPLEFQIGMPGQSSASSDGDQIDSYQLLAQQMERIWLARNGQRPSAELPRAVTLLRMYQSLRNKPIERIPDLDIAGNWRRSMLTEKQEWLRANIGLMSSNKAHLLTFQAQADGVHGMIAGTTGSGKSELIQTLISVLALNYDPRVINFVLIDYKNGPTVEPFRNLPHCVDMATNLEGNAVERIFIAVKAEINRRSEVLKESGATDLVEYRKKIIPTLPPETQFPKTFPHLFIIVDEFAEMIAQDSEYKAVFESITRLGRSVGISLILATQRPSGCVTDQMRANMKFRICLRVETTDDSKEILGRPDAASLPAIAGRGYIQVGGGSLVEVQTAWSGAPYHEVESKEILEILNLNRRDDDPPAMQLTTLLGWLVNTMALEAKQQGIPKPLKPWPAPLPAELPVNKPVDSTYIQKGRLGKEIVINPTVAGWLDPHGASPRWPAFDWSKPPSLKVSMGLVDNPYSAEQRMLGIDPADDPIIVLGMSGRGKTVFLKSLIISLAAQFSPAELHIYVLDFGRGGLKALRDLPHIGGMVDTNEDERVERLFRMIRLTIEERQRKLQAYDSIADFNAKNLDDPLPFMLVVIDNLVEFKEIYEKYLGDLIALVRDGRSFGISFVMTAALMGDVPGKLFNLLTRRITFTQIDASDYSSIVGRGWVRIPDVPGRGLITEIVQDRQQPLEFQVAIPVGAANSDPYRELARRMKEAWMALEQQDPAYRLRRARPVDPLPNLIELRSVLPMLGAGGEMTAAPIGINDLNREPAVIEFAAKGPHWLVIGPPVAGKTTTLRSLVLSLAYSYSPEQIALVLIDPSDPSRCFFNYGARDGASLDKLPHVLAAISRPEELDEIIKRLRAEFDETVIARLQGQPNFTPQDNRKRSIFVIIDHYDEADTFSKGGPGLAALSEIGKGAKLHLIIGGSLDIMRNSGDVLRRRVESVRYTLVLQDQETVRYMGVRLSSQTTKEMPPGRGFLIKAAQAAMVQIAAPVGDGQGSHSAEARLADLIDSICRAYPEPARWSYHGSDLAPLEEVIMGPLSKDMTTPAPAYTSTDDTSQIDLTDLLANQQAQLASLASDMPKQLDFHTVSYDIPDNSTESTAPSAAPNVEQPAGDNGQRLVAAEPPDTLTDGKLSGGV